MYYDTDSGNLLNIIFGCIMSTYFQERFKILKTTYKMSADEMAAVLTEASRQSVSAYENGTREPPIAALVSIATKFGISLDWLCGNSNEPYTENSVDNAEMRYYEGFRWNSGYIETSLFQNFNPFQPVYNEDALQNYSDPVKRHSFYTLEARANILVLLRYPNAISLTSKMDNVEPGTEAQSGENKKKRKKYFQVISDMKTVLNTEKAIYTIDK